MSISSLIAPMKERLAKATRGKWRVTPSHRLHGAPVVDTYDGEYVCSCATDAENMGVRDAQLIAHSRTDLEKLIAVVERMEEGLQLIDMRKEGFEEDLVLCPQIAFEALDEARKILERE